MATAVDFVQTIEPWSLLVIRYVTGAGGSIGRDDRCHAISPKGLYLGPAGGMCPAMIKASEVSIVVQGPVGTQGETHRCVQSLRTQLPKAEIVLSTWLGEDTSGLDYDLLVENQDPGSSLCHGYLPIYNNVNRQIISTRNGILAATRKYVMKIRSDLVLEHCGFLKYFGRFSRFEEGQRLFRQRILVSSVFSKNPKRIYPFPYHPSDWFHFGLREDVFALWDIPIAPEPETTRWFEKHPRPDPDLYPSFLYRYLPEQYIWVSFLRKHMNVDFNHIWDCTLENMEQSERSIINNLVILEPQRLGIRSDKYGFNFIEWLSLYSYGEWLSLYRRRCDPDAMFSLNLVCILKTCLVPLSYLTPLRLSRLLINSILRRGTGFFPAWERGFPRTYQFFLKVYHWLAH